MCPIVGIARRSLFLFEDKATKFTKVAISWRFARDVAGVADACGLIK